MTPLELACFICTFNLFLSDTLEDVNFASVLHGFIFIRPVAQNLFQKE